MFRTINVRTVVTEGTHCRGEGGGVEVGAYER